MNENKSEWKKQGVHPVIGIEWAYRKTTGNTEIIFKDKTYYSPREVEIVTKNGGLTKNIHNIKKIFEGEIIK